MKAYFENVDDLARFCAGLVREGIAFDVQESSAAGRYVVTMTGTETR